MKRVLITGSSGGIGASIAVLFSGCGAETGIHYNQNKAKAENVKSLIMEKGVKTELFQADLLDTSACKELILSFVRVFGGIDVLVNNAGGVYGYKNFEDLDDQLWDNTFALNTKAPFFLAKEALNFMREQGGGKIINISSISAKYGGSASTLHYGAAKAALDCITMGLAKACAPNNVLVNSVRAGFVVTEFHSKVGRNDINKRIQLIPLKKPGQPVDIARMVLFLASSAGDHITGEVFTVAGGD